MGVREARAQEQKAREAQRVADAYASAKLEKVREQASAEIQQAWGRVYEIQEAAAAESTQLALDMQKAKSKMTRAAAALSQVPGGFMDDAPDIVRPSTFKVVGAPGHTALPG